MKRKNKKGQTAAKTAIIKKQMSKKKLHQLWLVKNGANILIKLIILMEVSGRCT